jgi:putative transposase
MIVGWQVADTLRGELALDALEMAVWSRGDRMNGQLVHHSDRGVQGLDPLYRAAGRDRRRPLGRPERRFL